MSPGHAIFAVTMIALGAIGLSSGEFTPVWSGIAKGVAARQAIAYLCATTSLVTGLGLLWKRSALMASRVAAGAFALWMVAVRFPGVVRAPTGTGAWWGVGDTAAMLGACLVLYAWLSDEQRKNGLRIARALYGLGLIPFGVAHFTYVERTASMVPPWLPWHLAIAYLTGATFIAAGVAIVAGTFARLAATLSVVQIGLFTLFVWGPVIIAGGYTASQWAEILNSCAMMSAGWVVADSYRGMPWSRMSS